MSIYGGFPTRSLESSYNQYLCEVITLLQNLVLGIIKKTKTNETLIWGENFLRTYQKLAKLEKQKYLVPRYSDYLKDLEIYLKAINCESSIGRVIERASPPTTSTGSFLGDFEYSKGEYNRSRQSSLPGYRNRDEEYIIKNNQKRYGRDLRTKKYQDQILQSILKDLADPYLE